MKDFSPKWCQWVASFMEGGHVGVKVNDKLEKKFKPKKVFGRAIGYHISYLI
jgi:hypothetical protein